jgi:hypothetical protein
MPKFQRVSLAGSDELFRPTRVQEEEERPVQETVADEIAPADVIGGRTHGPTSASGPLPSAALPPLAGHRTYHRVQLTEEQVKTLVEGVQKLKYPHQVNPDAKPSMEEFEELEQLRKILVDTLD